jgi:hypothetical protein
VTSEKNGKKQTQTLGQQNKGELKKARGSAKGRKQKKTKGHPGGSGTAIGVHTNGWPQSRKIGWCVGGCWITPALLHALFTFLHSEATLYLFLSFSKTFLNSHFIATTY